MVEPVNQIPTDQNQPIAQPPIVESAVLPPSNLPPATSKRLPWIIGGILLFFLVIGGMGYFLLTPKNESAKKTTRGIISQLKGEPTAVMATPTPMAFRDLTVPFLREQKYDSKLGDLEAAYEGANYSAYTTSYTSDGLKINGLITKPTGDAPEGGWPAVVFVHGYIPPTSYETQGQAYSSYVDYIASRGYVVFKIDLRGHAQSEGEPGGAYYSSDYIIDTLNAYSALQNSDFVNPKKVGLWGHSMAGNIAARSIAAKPDIPAVVIWAGAGYTYADLIKYRITDASFQPQANNTQRLRRRQQIYETYGSPSASVKFWQETAPVSYLKDFKGAIQIHHAVDDNVVSIDYSRDLNALLDKTAIPHEFYAYLSGGHNISGSSYGEAMQRTVEFYNAHLK